MTITKAAPAVTKCQRILARSSQIGISGSIVITNGPPTRKLFDILLEPPALQFSDNQVYTPAYIIADKYQPNVTRLCTIIMPTHNRPDTIYMQLRNIHHLSSKTKFSDPKFIANMQNIHYPDRAMLVRHTTLPTIMLSSSISANLLQKTGRNKRAPRPSYSKSIPRQTRISQDPREREG